MNKKGMEMWVLILIILAIILLLAVLIWFGDLGGMLEKLLGKFGEGL